MNTVVAGLFWPTDSVARMAGSVVHVVCFAVGDLINWPCVVARLGLFYSRASNGYAGYGKNMAPFFSFSVQLNGSLCEMY